MNDTKERINKMLKKSEVILQAGKPKHNDDVKLEKKWENTVWDTDIYLDDIDDWGVCKDCAIKDKCSNL